MRYLSNYYSSSEFLPTVAKEATRPTTWEKKRTKETFYHHYNITVQQSHRHRSNSESGNNSTMRNKAPWIEWLASRRARKIFARLLKLGPLFQLLVLFVIFMLVLQADSKANFAAEQLLLYEEEESTLLLRLQRLEYQSIHLHQNIRKRLHGSNNHNDEDPLGKQMVEMSEELNEQVSTLQNQISTSSIHHIVKEYGEGPVKVVFELEFLNQASTNGQMSILLWPDTPHAAWTWLEQIERHIWDDADFSWDLTQPTLDLTPSKADPLNRGQMEFVEHHKVSSSRSLHEAWTVGLRQTEEGALQLFLNLQDNGEYQKHETCVGKILNGYDSLQRLLGATRFLGEEDDAAAKPKVRVKRISAMHLTKNEIGMNHL